MSTATNRHTVDEYFEVEFASEERHEYIDGEIIDMVGASNAHNKIHLNLVRVLIARFFDSEDFRICMDNTRVKIESPVSYLFPDMALVAGPEELEVDRRDTILNPAAVFEILSPSTERYNRNRKFELYQRVESLQYYVLISQETVAVECFSRQPDGRWQGEVFVGSDATVTFESLNWKLSVAELYKKTDLTTEKNR